MYSEIYGGIIKQLGEVIYKVFFVVWIDGLVLFFVFFFYGSYVLYNEVMIMGENVMIYCDKFEVLKKEMKLFRDFIDIEFILQWKKDNIVNLEKIVDNLL